jgi:hypothetical protein
MKSITKYAADHEQENKMFWSKVSILSVQSVCMSVFLEFSTADLSKHPIGACMYLLERATASKEDIVMIKIPVDIICPHTPCHRFKGLIEAFLIFSKQIN